MPTPFRKVLSKVLSIVYLSAIATLLAWSIDQTKLFRLIALKAADLHYLIEPPRTPDNIVLIVVDQKSLNALPVPTMFWHRYYAPAIQAAAAAGAKVLGLDEAFGITVDKYVQGLGEKEMSQLDEKMAEAVVSTSSVMPVICAYIPTEMANQESQAVPMNIAAAALGQTAYVNLTADEDDFIRSIELTEPGDGQQPKAMALAVAERFLGHTPAYPSRVMLIRYAGPAGTVRRISLVDFLAAAEAKNMGLLRSWVGGKAVLLGPEMDTSDRHATPYYAFTAGPHANTSGVEIHANALNTLLTGRFLRKVPPAVAVTLMFVFAFLFSLTTIEAAGWRLIGWHAFLTVVLFAGAHLSFRSGWLVPSSSLLMSALVAFLLSLVTSYLTAARHRDAFRKAVNLFVGKEVAEAVESTGKVSLSGRRVHATILFSDIRGFTAFSETQEPETVVALLNEYLSAMTGFIVRHGGQVNKFIGDGILAIFSDEVANTQPGAQSDRAESHAVRAVRCATEMVAAPSRFQTGTGIHSGYVVVGNVGSGDKLDYTALGDTVNLASRLEGLNKQFKSNLLFSEVTRELVGAAFDVTLLGETNVKGKSAPVRVYTVSRGGGQ
ncbi:MAG: adenylate/guanylate cyclase domain-containing protein [Bryobacteraceae bacterium]